MSMRRRPAPLLPHSKAGEQPLGKKILVLPPHDSLQYVERMTNFANLGLHHVRLAIPKGIENTARAVCSGVLGLTELPKPDALAGRGGVWFGSGTLELHLGVEDPFSPAQKAHPALIVDDLNALFASLSDSGGTDQRLARSAAVLYRRSLRQPD